MPWMVAFFFVLVVPLGGVSIFFIIIQPIVIGTYCTLCLLAALAMLVMIPLTLDEVVAMGQYMQRSVREGRPFWRTFFRGGPEPNGGVDENCLGFSAALLAQSAAAVRGVTVPNARRVLPRRGAAHVFAAGSGNRGYHWLDFATALSFLRVASAGWHVRPDHHGLSIQSGQRADGMSAISFMVA